MRTYICPFKLAGIPHSSRICVGMYQLILGKAGRCALIGTVTPDVRQLLQYDRDMNAAHICRLFFFPMC